MKTMRNEYRDLKKENDLIFSTLAEYDRDTITEIISVADINNPSVFRIHGVAVRDRAQLAIKSLYLRHDLTAFFLADFCFIAFQPFLFSAPDIQRLFVGRVDFPFCTAVKGFGILRHEHIQFIEVDIRQNWANQ